MSNNDNFFKNFTNDQSTVAVTTDPFERKVADKSIIAGMKKDRREVMCVRNFMERSDAYRQPHLLLSISTREAFENWKDAGRTITRRSRLKMPDGYNVVESQAAQLYQMFFKDDEVIELKGSDPNSAQLEMPMSQFVNNQLKKAKVKLRGYEYLHAMLLDGTAFAKVPYKFKEKSVIKREKSTNPETGQVEITKREGFKIEHDGPDLEIISIHDFFPDWTVKTAGDVQSMRGVTMRTYRTLNELKQAGVYKNLDQLEASIRTKGSKHKTFAGHGRLNSPFWQNEWRDQQDRAQDNRFQAKSAGQIEIWEYWGQFDPKGDGKMEEYTITIANGDVSIRSRVNIYDDRFKPFVATPNIARDAEFYGLPELAPQKAQIKELNQLKNSRLDAINSSVNPMWKIERGAGVNIDQLVRRPDGIVLTNQNDGIQPLQTNETTPTSAQEIAQIQADIQQTSATGAGATAAGRAFARTTAGVDFISGQASARLGLKASFLSETFLQPVAEIFQKHNRQYVDEDQIFMFSNPRVAQLDPRASLPIEAFGIEFDFKAKTDFETGGKEGKLAVLREAGQFIQALEQSSPGSFIVSEIGEAALREMFNFGSRRFVRTDEERQALQEQQLAAEQAVNAQTGANAPQPNAKPGNK